MFDRFSCRRKYSLDEPFFNSSDRWAFHLRSQEMLSPRTFAVSTISNGLLLITIKSNFGSVLANEMCNSLHFVTFNWNLLALDLFTWSSTEACILLTLLFGTGSAVVISLTNFHRSKFPRLRSFIIIKKSHGPSFVPRGTPAGTVPHSEKHSCCYYYCTWIFQIWGAGLLNVYEGASE